VLKFLYRILLDLLPAIIDLSVNVMCSQCHFAFNVLILIFFLSASAMLATATICDI